ncbi:ABC transporter ATP-binding protein [Ignicoccus islandicus DSM 13165]|uniref:ABC transporter ATP-binding protein n=1 Tax=Ignicoccus islandicus DSM 13165 TaxID=940295 RepID=A0A0U2WKH0_9CREN|nr:metal ABC transporter ATP-binding protein [Ignicoccus islandicus]ALU11441.1 ABC transporter ATP-binding protein [Ignicoccus islandicus DSM 13165]
MTTSTKVVSFDDVWVKYDREYALQGVTFDVPEKDFLVVLGPNGAGKTTLLKTILGVVKPAKGRVLVFGKEPWAHRDVIVNYVGYVPQREHINEKVPLKVIDVVMMGLTVKKFFFNKKKAYEKAIEVLQYVGLKDLAFKNFNELSGGQKQRVLIARAIISDPKLLLLDEPFSALDANSSRLVSSLLKRLNDEGKTIILVTHTLDPVFNVMKRLLLLNKKLIAIGPPKEVLTPENLKKAYGIEVPVVTYNNTCYPILGDQHGR